MDMISIENSLNRNWSYSPNLDPDGDGVITSDEGGYIYNIKGPFKTKSYMPFLNNYIDVIKTAVIIITISLGATGVYSIFGCKSKFLQYNNPYQTQIVIFLVLLINIFMVRAEKNEAGRSWQAPFVSFVLAIVCLLAFNIVAKLGNIWATYNSPFWPGPLTWWGVIMLGMIIIYTFDIQREYWKKAGNKTFGSKALDNEKYYKNLEVGGVVAIIIIIIIGFFNELITQKRLLKDKFRFIDFFFGIGLTDKVYKHEPIQSYGGHCNTNLFKVLDKEVKKGIKNSVWTKFTKWVKSLL